MIRGGQISHIQNTVAKRGLTNQANIDTPMWKSRLKSSTAEFQSDPAILAAIGHRVGLRQCAQRSGGGGGLSNKSNMEAMRKKSRDLYM